MSNNPGNLKPLPAKQTADNGGDFAALLQPKHRAAFVDDAALETPAGRVALRNAMVAAGLMLAS